MNRERSSRNLARAKGSFLEVSEASESNSTNHTNGVLPQGLHKAADHSVAL